MVSRVSVVVPTIGRLGSLRECLLAISRQSYEPFEVLVVHDGNNRHLVKQVVASFGAIYIPGLGRGVIEAYNTAVRYAKGDIIAFTDDDAIPGPRWLEEMVALYTEGVGAVGGIIEIIQDGHNGLLVPSGDVERLFASLERLLKERSFSRRLGFQGRKTVVEKFTIERMIRETLDAYRLALRKPSRFGIVRQIGV